MLLGKWAWQYVLEGSHSCMDCGRKVGAGAREERKETSLQARIEFLPYQRLCCSPVLSLVEIPCASSYPGGLSMGRTLSHESFRYLRRRRRGREGGREGRSSLMM